MRNLLRSAFVLILIVSFYGCGMKAVINKDQYNTVKNVAVITYTVPEKIEFSDDPKAPKTASLTDLAKLVIKGLTVDSSNAATLAHEKFTSTINAQGLSFVVMSRADMLANPDFAALYQPPAPAEADSGKSKLAAIGSLFGVKSGPPKGVSPKFMNQYGLATDWSNGTALMGTPEEKEYIKAAIKALNVDAAILISDPGFSFSCEACVGTAGVMSGAASTGSAFLITMVGPDGEIILDMREWFATTDEQAALVAGVVNPLEVDDLFIEHGNKAAIVFADFLKAQLAETK